MTLVSDAAASMISDFGVTVEVTPHTSQEPEDVDNPVFFEESSDSPPTFEQKVRLYTTASDDQLMRYGFESDGDAILYTDEDVIEEGDEIAYSDLEYIVRSSETNQINEEQGQYLWIFELVEK